MAMKTKLTLVTTAALAASTLIVSSAKADTIPISVAARLGYGVPTGSASKSPAGTESKMSDRVGGVVPLQVDAMYYLGFGLRIGLYGSYGVLTGVKAAGGDATDASGSQTRLGAQAHFTLPLPIVKPWVGAGIGYEWLNTKSTVAGSTAESGAKGLEMLNLQAGLQLSLLPILSLGPYVQYQMGKYSTFTSGSGGDTDIPSSQKATHGWIQGGLRAELSF
jgi:OmpA-OmpF porin, OOP family